MHDLAGGLEREERRAGAGGRRSKGIHGRRRRGRLAFACACLPSAHDAHEQRHPSGQVLGVAIATCKPKGGGGRLRGAQEASSAICMAPCFRSAIRFGRASGLRWRAQRPTGQRVWVYNGGLEKKANGSRRAGDDKKGRKETKRGWVEKKDARRQRQRWKTETERRNVEETSNEHYRAECEWTPRKMVITCARSKLGAPSHRQVSTAGKWTRPGQSSPGVVVSMRGHCTPETRCRLFISIEHK